MEEAIDQARRKKDDRRVWELIRILGGTGRRERKRNIRDVQAEDPVRSHFRSSPSLWAGCLGGWLGGGLGVFRCHLAPPVGARGRLGLGVFGLPPRRALARRPPCSSRRTRARGLLLSLGPLRPGAARSLRRLPGGVRPLGRINDGEELVAKKRTSTRCRRSHLRIATE